MLNKNVINYGLKWKTVKDYLNEFDKDELAAMYIRQLPFPYDDRDLQDMTLREINAKIRSIVSDFIERLRTIEVKYPEDGDRDIIYAVNCIAADCSISVDYELVSLNEFVKNPHSAMHYSCILSDQAEAAGFLVTETPLTMNHIKELIVEVLLDISSFGFGPEGREEVLAMLEQGESAAAEGRLVSNKDVWRKLQDKLGGGARKDDNPLRANSYYREILYAKAAFERYSRASQRKIILNLLHLEDDTVVDDQTLLEVEKRIIEENREVFIALVAGDKEDLETSE